MAFSPVVPMAVNHWVVGGITLVILVGMLLALIAFGGGREHT